MKDPNPIIRANCGIGLAELGVHTLRTLLIGLHDNNPAVRQTIEKVIVSQMNIEDIIKHFSQEESGGNKISSLRIAIREILDKQYPISLFTINYFKQLLGEIENYENYVKNNPQENMNEKPEMEGEPVQNNQNYGGENIEENGEENYEEDGEEYQNQEGEDVEYEGEEEGEEGMN